LRGNARSLLFSSVSALESGRFRCVYLLSTLVTDIVRLSEG